MSLNKNLLQEYPNKIQAKLDELDLDVELTLGNCSYGESHATFKLELQVKGGDSKELSDLKQINRVRNYDLDKIHIDGVHHFKLVGWKSRARSKPFIVECQKSKSKYVIDEKTCDRWFKKFVSAWDDNEVGDLTLVDKNTVNGN